MHSNFSPRSEMSAPARDNEPDVPADDFWRYSARLYGKPGISEKCLRLQDDAGIDINLMLFCCWIGFRAGKTLHTEEIRALLEVTRDWREGAIKPIRRLRRELKGLTARTEGSGFVYDAIKHCELDAEKVKQRLLIRAAGTIEIIGAEPIDAAETALANIERYFALQGVEEGDWAGVAVAAIIAAAAELSDDGTPD